MNINSGTWHEIELQKRIQQQVEQLEAKNQQFRQALKKISIQKCSCLDCKSKVFMAQQALEE